MDALQTPVDIARMAKLFGKPGDRPSDDPLTVTAFLSRTGLNLALIERLLSGAIENPQLYLIRLAALQLYLEKANALDARATRAIRNLESQIEATFWPTHAAGGDGEFFIPFRLREGVYGNDPMQAGMSIRPLRAQPRRQGPAMLKGSFL